MKDDELPFDPATLLPFECRLEPNDAKVKKLPRAYRGSISHDLLGADSRRTYS